MIAKKAATSSPGKGERPQGCDGISIARHSLNAASAIDDRQENLRAELKGRICTAAGITVTANAPILGLCRALVAAGHDPSKKLLVFRGDILAMSVRAIGLAAKLRTATHGVGFEVRPECTAGLQTPAGNTQRQSRVRGPKSPPRHQVQP